MPRNPLSPPLTTAAVIAEARQRAAVLPEARVGDVIRETRLINAHMSPEARIAAARAAAVAMTDAEWRELLQRSNAGRMTEARARVNASDAAVGAVLHACPRCGAEARGHSDGERADWFGGHYRTAHPEVGY